jgi:hypothetical protein
VATTKTPSPLAAWPAGPNPSDLAALDKNLSVAYSRRDSAKKSRDVAWTQILQVSPSIFVQGAKKLRAEAEKHHVVVTKLDAKIAEWEAQREAIVNPSQRLPLGQA